MNLRYIVGGLMLLAPTAMLRGQNTSAQYRYAEAKELWNKTDVAAGLTVDTSATRGFVSMGYSHEAGTYHRVQEYAMSNKMQFATERYQPLGANFYGYGRVAFDMNHQKDRAWSDVMRTYNSDPFMAGSERKANYDDWNIDLTAAMGTRAYGGWRFGARLDYKLGDLTRLLDPRSRSEMVNYRITPSVTYTFGKSTVGVSGYYDRYKEKIPSVTTVGTQNYVYYQMTGLENAAGVLGGHGGFQREWVNHCFGATLAYGYHTDAFSSLSTMGISRGSEGIYGQYKYEPGHYYSYTYGLTSRNRLKGDAMIHELDVEAQYKEDYADEYRQRLEITTDAQTGYNSYRYVTQLNFKKRYQVKVLDVNFRYRANFTNHDEVFGYAGLEGKLNHARNKHLLYDSHLKYGSFRLTAQSGWRILTVSKEQALWVDAEAGYSFAKDAELSLYDATGDYAKGVLLADMQYLNSDYMHGRVKVTYQFPMTIKKHRSNWFVSAFAEGLHTNKADGYDNSLNRTNFGFTIGIFN